MSDEVFDLGERSQGGLSAIRINGVDYSITSTAEDYLRLVEYYDQIMKSAAGGTKKVAKVFKDDLEFARAALGEETVEQMITNRVPLLNLIQSAQYAFWTVTAGRAVADQVFEPAEPAEDAGAEFPKQSKSGQSTASETRTKTASTKGTVRSRSTSAKSSTRKSTAKKK